MTGASGWKNPSLLLFAIGISSVGNFVYLVAINIMVLQLTGSAAAVAGLWIIGPLTNIVTKFWTGSFIDYRSKKNIMLVTYVLRALFIFMIPLAPNMVVIYGVLVILSVAQAFHTPASMTYIAMTVPKEKRKRFNAIRSFCDSSAFIIGPALGGTLIYLSSVEVTLWLNAAFFILAALFLLFLPKAEDMNREAIPSLTVRQVVRDFAIVKEFMANHRYVTFIYLGFIVVMTFTFAMDAQEVVFVQRVIGLSEVDYTLLISITGIGAVVGALALSIFSNRISIRLMIAIGIFMTACGYVIYAFSWSFTSISVGFILLGFFNVFLNAGILTFYQNNIPTVVMGRVTSIFQLIQSVLHVGFILGVGVFADLISLRLIIVLLAVIMLVMSVLFAMSVLAPKRKSFFQEEGGKQ
ncbi:MFS transporter [Geomicrobium sp. JCM 19039]|uniref:MFS transporter n=1 Tax=Geomicrobium sp. JCM 19039 TaxID=1460636 RepID=UPI00045F3334|nr:MFS transporter [Geomicrobium sp. JCM 19039]GAK14404.1 MFS general substrate transporter [Geomicrobium sp. JCM 19039]